MATTRRISPKTGHAEVSIRPYAEGDQWVLEKTLGDPRNMVHLNGPESMDKIKKRHAKFVEMAADQHAGCPFTILAGPKLTPAGNVGYWESELKGTKGWEMGWFVLPELQGQGIGTAAVKLVIDRLAEMKTHSLVFAYSSIENMASSAVCRKVGFQLAEVVRDEYPPSSGLFMNANVWTLNLPSGRRRLRISQRFGTDVTLFFLESTYFLNIGRSSS